MSITAQPAADTSSAAANPVVDDMSITLLPGRYKHLTMIDRPEGLAPPPVVFFHLGGPAASRAAADPVCDEIALCNLVSAEATTNDRSRQPGTIVNGHPSSS